MSQDFHGSVGQVAAGDIQNLEVKIHVLGKQEDKGLVPAQRKELHALRAKCEELGEHPRDVWRRVHAQLGVKSISEIASEQFSEARTVIQERLDQLQEEADQRRIGGKILRMSTEKDVEKEIVNFCELTFGRTQLNSFKRSELQQVLEFAQRLEVRTQSIQDEQTTTRYGGANPLPLLVFLSVHRWHASGVFLTGLFLGRYLF